jgi:hypothetical protein
MHGGFATNDESLAFAFETLNLHIFHVLNQRDLDILPNYAGGAKDETIIQRMTTDQNLLRSESRVVCLTNGCNPRSLQERS